MKKTFLLIFFLALIPFSVYGDSNNPYDFKFYDYKITDLNFLRSYYYEINNGRKIQFEGFYKSMNWLEPYKYQERLSLIGFDINQYNLIRFNIEALDGYNYAFPILMFHTQTGDLQELNQLNPGDRIRIYGRFYNLKDSDYAVQVDMIDTIKEGGHEIDMVLDGRISPTPTPTPTITPTPGPNIIQRINLLIHPPPTATPTGTITPVEDDSD